METVVKSQGRGRTSDSACTILFNFLAFKNYLIFFSFFLSFLLFYRANINLFLYDVYSFLLFTIFFPSNNTYIYSLFEI